MECVLLYLLMSKLLDGESRKMCGSSQMYERTNFKGEFLYLSS